VDLEPNNGFILGADVSSEHKLTVSGFERRLARGDALYSATIANILYGVNGEGSGHSTRAKEVLRHLVRQGHSVHVASFDRGLANLKDDFQVTEIYGLRLS
jgi:Glycosyl transferase family 1